MELDPAEPWAVREGPLDVSALERTESLLTLSNGLLGVRGGLDEGEPHGSPGTYLSGAFELWPMTYPEYSYGYPRVQERIVTVPDATRIELFVDGERFDVRAGDLQRHERVLDLRSGTLRRTVHWTSPRGVPVRIRSERLVPLQHPRLMAVDYRVEVLDGEADVEVRSAVVAGEELHDPVVTASRAGGSLRQHTDGSGQAVAVLAEHDVTGPADVVVTSSALPDRVVTTSAVRLPAGAGLRVVKLAVLGWSEQLACADLLHDLRTELDTGLRAGWDDLAAGQREEVARFWEHADVRVDGDDDLQQAVRFALFHILQATARAADRSIPAKGLTGTGYDGHTFWDTEVFVLPMLNHVYPQAAAASLRWRHRMLPVARQRARELRLAGAAFPWRTISGRETSGYWPASTAAVHLNADIADAAVRHVHATGDEALAREVVVDLVVETARLWVVLGRQDEEGRFHVDGVTGPDEYSALVDDNAYTNLMAQANLRCALDLTRRHPDVAAALGVDEEEVRTWERLADAVHVPRDARTGMHVQDAGSGDRLRWDFEGTGPQEYPLADHFPYFSLYRRQVAKQADLVLAMHLRPDAFTPEEKRRAFDYYEGLTVRDSSLSAATQAVIAAEVGHLGLAADYAREAAFVDLHDLRASTADGLHIASLAGVWSVLVAGFGGMRDADGQLTFAPRLPGGLRGLCFRTLHRGSCLEVSLTRDDATYRVLQGPAVTTRHHGREITVEPGASLTLPVEPLPPLPRPAQPPGRDPAQLLRAASHGHRHVPGSRPTPGGGPPPDAGAPGFGHARAGDGNGARRGSGWAASATANCCSPTSSAPSPGPGTGPRPASGS